MRQDHELAYEQYRVHRRRTVQELLARPDAKQLKCSLAYPWDYLTLDEVATVLPEILDVYAPFEREGNARREARAMYWPQLYVDAWPLKIRRNEGIKVFPVRAPDLVFYEDQRLLGKSPTLMNLPLLLMEDDAKATALEKAAVKHWAGYSMPMRERIHARFFGETPPTAEEWVLRDQTGRYDPTANVTGRDVALEHAIDLNGAELYRSIGLPTHRAHRAYAEAKSILPDTIVLPHTASAMHRPRFWWMGAGVIYRIVGEDRGLAVLDSLAPPTTRLAPNEREVVIPRAGEFEVLDRSLCLVRDDEWDRDNIVRPGRFRTVSTVITLRRIRDL